MRPVFAAYGVDFDTRVRLHGYVSEAQFLTETWQADLVLDALHWSGGNTALETLWGEVPILTLPGRFMRGRHTAAMLWTMDLPELVARDRDDFIARGAALVGDREARLRLRASIREHKHRLYRDPGVLDTFAELIEREVRAFAPFPGSWFELDRERIKVLKGRVIGVNGAPGTVLDDEFTIACGDAAIRPLTVQRAGKPAMPTRDFLRGKSVPVGTVLR